MKRTIIPEIKKELIYKLAQCGCREDDRSLEDFRSISFETDVISTAEGSARLTLGKTDVLVGVKLQPGEPYPDKQDQGVLMTGCELKPMAHPGFESGAPSDESVEIARVVDRGIRESGMLDMQALCIEPGKKIWMVFLDIHVINYDGNLFDAATMASLLALHTTAVPASRFGLGEDFPLPVNLWPVTITFVKLRDILMADPTVNEELSADARFTVSVDDNGHFRAMQKGLKGSLTYDDVVRALDMAQKMSLELRTRIQTGE
ncbi:MAG: exosome complex protein Rrp42 [Candidatus Thermoplasmatota archaeon]|nr:exosome complex protein Rrp42 [Euryarchaeota archaeon]MBU4031430.1 exosome complex protein Rrp42 [Candidatus Thermoplasmatota archaeon]MBU4071095.1 exosome complex protein Rrp42 [Candidatus Thermoplasmatota archaeon]MBU4144977.1 exosome complex protein Rrp42 [Candidatus Thermoplasmatota archaeon]MBU4591117.1 exosome complex protein Rrp42 [Candidatus Thermoplasmatota archaeon]